MVLVDQIYCTWCRKFPADGERVVPFSFFINCHGPPPPLPQLYTPVAVIGPTWHVASFVLATASQWQIQQITTTCKLCSLWQVSLYQDLISSFPTDFESNKFAAAHSGKMLVVSRILSCLHQGPQQEKIVLVSSYTQVYPNIVYHGN